jgi:hypothetical protein
VRRFDLACTSESVVRTISDNLPSNALQHHLPLQHPDEQSTMFISTLPAQTEAMDTFTQDARVGGDTCGGIVVAEYEDEKTIGFAV